MPKSTVHMTGGLIVLWVALISILGGSLIEPVVFLLQVGGCCLAGAAVIVSWRRRFGSIEIVWSTILGLTGITSIYAVARDSDAAAILYVMVLTAIVFGAWQVARVQRSGGITDPLYHQDIVRGHDATIAGFVIMLMVGFAYYFSGRIDVDGVSFYGPMARDHIFHIAVQERLRHVFPPDNFVMSGYPFPNYHFFSDLTIYILTNEMGFKHDLFNVYFRYYPSLNLFLIGWLAWWSSAHLAPGRWVAALGTGLICFGGDFSWVLGLAQTLKVFPNWALMQERLFDPWIGWHGFGAIMPLVHRPAYYNGLMIFLAGLATVIGPKERIELRAWCGAGAFWGLLAGYNYTLAASLGVAVLLAWSWFVLRRKRIAARNLLACGLVLGLSSLFANYFIIWKGALESDLGGGLGQIWSIAPAALAIDRYGGLVGALPSAVRGVAAVILLVVISYGIKLTAVFALQRGRRNELFTHGELAAVGSVLFGVCIVFGLILRQDAMGGVANNIIYLQPTGWLLAFLAVAPLAAWGSTKRWKAVLVTGLICIGPLQALAQFNLGEKVVVDAPMLKALRDIREKSAPSDVVAFLPNTLTSLPLYGRPSSFNNFFVPALTGLRGLYSSPGYSKFFGSERDSQSRTGLSPLK